MLVLRPFTHEHIPSLIRWATSAELVMQWAGPLFRYPLTMDQFAYLDEASTTRDLLPFGAFMDDDPKLVGYAELRNIDPVHLSALVTRVIVAPEARGAGLGKQLMEGLLRIGFQKLHLHRIGLGVFDFNSPAIACYEAVGFRNEGIRREVYRVGDTFWSLVQMSILETEWPPRNW
ncbi:MAG: hypothetical protein QOF51_1657 [Chloroflexota bacterium]|jgi:RimJ/RimL family protein N-acetyltransferase|nr:hypothetical protein [Chloroflexota bacterium]